MRAAWVLFRGLNLRYFATHKTRSALSIAGVALGVMLLFGALIENASSAGSLAKLNRQTRGTADIEVTTPALAGVDEGTADLVRGIAGVKAAAPVLQERALVRGTHATRQVLLLGYDDHLNDFSAGAVDPRRVDVRRKDVPGLVLTPQLLDQVGDPGDGPVSVAALGQTSTQPVVGVMPRDVGAELNGGRVAALPLPIAQAILQHPGRVTSVYVESNDRSPAAISALKSRIETSLGDRAQVLAADHTVSELGHSTEQFQSITNLLSLLALLLGAYVVFITMSMAAVERRREFSIMLALGDPARRLLARFLLEASLLGLLGSVVGVVGGYFLGRYLVGTTPAYLEDAYGFTTSVIVPAWGVPVALGAGVVMAVVAAIGPAVSVLRLPPAEALRPQPLGEAPSRPRTQVATAVVGAILLAAGGAGTVLVPRLGFVFTGLTFVGWIFLLPAAFTALFRLIASVLVGSRSRLGAGLYQLVGANLLGGPRRTVAAVSAAALALGLVVGNGALFQDSSDSVHRYSDKFRHYDLIANADNDLYAQLPFGASAPAAASRVRGVDSVQAGSFSLMSWRGRRVFLIGTQRETYLRFRLDQRAGNTADTAASMDGDGIAVSTQVAHEEGVKVDDNLVLPTADGNHTFKISGIVEDLGWPEGVMLIGEKAFTTYMRQPEYSQLLLTVAPGSNSQATRAGLRDALGPDLSVRSGDEFSNVITGTNDAILTPFNNMRNVSVLVAVLAVFNTLLIAVLQRRRELGVLMAIGLQRRQLQLALLLEAIIMVAVAFVAAIGIGLAFQFLGINALVATTGLPFAWAFQPAAIGIGALSALVIVVAGSLYPARQAGRVPMLEAIAYE